MPCTQQVVVTYDKKKKPLSYRLECSGKCADGTECKPKSETDDDTHTTREYCACKGGNGDESKPCHIVLYTVKNKAGRTIEQYFKCESDPAEKCPDGKKCFPKIVGHTPFDDDPTKYKERFFECGCWPEDDDVWREK